MIEPLANPDLFNVTAPLGLGLVFCYNFYKY